MTTNVDIGSGAITVRELLERAEPGDELVLERDGRVVARVTCSDANDKHQHSVEADPGVRPLRCGLYRGQGWMSDDFDAPLPGDDLTALLRGKIES